MLHPQEIQLHIHKGLILIKLRTQLTSESVSTAVDKFSYIISTFERVGSSLSTSNGIFSCFCRSVKAFIFHFDRCSIAFSYFSISSSRTVCVCKVLASCITNVFCNAAFCTLGYAMQYIGKHLIWICNTLQPSITETIQTNQKKKKKLKPYFYQ
jgi:MFS-type transporter involved in bile tolerance (Atg22 family)